MVEQHKDADFGYKKVSPEEKTRLVREVFHSVAPNYDLCLLYTSPSPRDLSTSRMPSSA